MAGGVSKENPLAVRGLQAGLAGVSSC